MSSSPETLTPSELLEEIKPLLDDHRELDPQARAGVLAKISRLRDAVETPLDSVLRIYTQVFPRSPFYQISTLVLTVLT